jgi:hypothetical protein
MGQASLVKHIHQSIGTVFAGMIAVVALSIGTDIGLSTLGWFPTIGQPMGDPLLLVATDYRTVYGILGGYLAARLAPVRPMTHALVLGFIGLAVSILGVVVTWNQESTYGHAWYPLALVALAMPQAWAGGKLREIQMTPRMTLSERSNP